MKTKGIRISDKKDRVLWITLSEILEEVDEKTLLHWSILFLEGAPNPGEGKFLTEYANKINRSENGLFISWKDLLLLSSKFFQMYEVIVLGSKDVTLLHRYESEQEMYETCDISIEMIDCTYWEVFSIDEELIQRLAKKFKDIELIAPDFKR